MRRGRGRKTPGRTDREPDEQAYGGTDGCLNAGNNWTAKVTDTRRPTETDIAAQAVGKHADRPQPD